MQIFVPPHWLGTPPPPHVCGSVHDPQSITPPQPSPIGPHVACADAQVTSVQPVSPMITMSRRAAS
jgi:hypothetical protein